MKIDLNFLTSILFLASGLVWDIPLFVFFKSRGMTRKELDERYPRIINLFKLFLPWRFVITSIWFLWFFSLVVLQIDQRFIRIILFSPILYIIFDSGFNLITGVTVMYSKYGSRYYFDEKISYRWVGCLQLALDTVLIIAWIFIYMKNI